MIFSTMAKRSKRQVSLQCFKKWQSFYDKEYQTLSWLKCDVDQDDKTSVHLLWCAVCRQFEDYIRSTKNFSEAWIYGSDNHRVSNITDHAKSTQHNTAMFRLRLEQKKRKWWFNRSILTNRSIVTVCICLFSDSLPFLIVTVTVACMYVICAKKQ